MELKKPKVLLITGNELRHRFFAFYLSKIIDLRGVIFEKKANKHQKINFGEDGNQIIQEHFFERAQSGKKYFNDVPELSSKIRQLDIGVSESNTVESFNWIKSLNVDLIQLYGSSIIKDHLLNAFDNKVLNLHLGLSPYYRGSGTNFWPCVHHNLACVGATIHLAVLEADAGGILHQFRPEIALGDSIHDIGNKTILKAPKIVSKVLSLYYNQLLTARQQDLSIGLVCFRKDLNPSAIKKMKSNFANGMVANYHKVSCEQLNKYDIINQLKDFD